VSEVVDVKAKCVFFRLYMICGNASEETFKVTKIPLKGKTSNF
jgi:hypothetical protein